MGTAIRIMSNTIQTLWIGNTLSPMEILSLNSFVKNGMEIHLYCYEDIKNVPQGVVIKDGRDILPKEDIFAYQVGEGKGSYSAFSNYFRYKLLYEKGGWWVDTDMICLQPWNFTEDYVFCCEENYETGLPFLNTGAIKCPAGDELMNYCYNECLKKDKQTLEWGIVGPKLLNTAVHKFKYNKFVKPTRSFSLVAPFRSQLFIIPKGGVYGLNVLTDLIFTPGKNVYGLHLWNEAWNRIGISKHIDHDVTSIYEQLKLKYV